MSDYPSRFVSTLLDAGRIRELMGELPALLRSLLTDDPVLRIRYGWGCEIHPALQYIDMEVSMSGLDRFLSDSLRQKIVIPGESDLYIHLPKGRLTVVFCHEGHVHSGGSNWQLETSLWTRGSFAAVDLTDCPGIGLRKMAAEPAAPPNSRPPLPLPTSPEIQSSDSLRTPSSGGCG